MPPDVSLVLLVADLASAALVEIRCPLPRAGAAATTAAAAVGGEVGGGAALARRKLGIVGCRFGLRRLD